VDEDASWYGGRPRLRPHCVTWGTSYPSKKGHSSPQFRPVSVVAKRLMDQDASKYGDIVSDGDPAPPKKGKSTATFRPMSTVAKRLDGSRCHLVWR